MQAILTAIDAFFAVEQSEPRRIFHGRGQCFPGLEHICVDWFAPVVLITAYDEVSQCEELVKAITAADSTGQVMSVVLQRRYEQGAPADTLHGETLETVIVQESGLNFEVHPGRRQNSGLFLDMAPTRRWLLAEASGRNVLNLFAYTCSFSVAALAGGATGVTNVDMSKTSLTWGAKNHDINSLDPRRVKYIPHNLFRSWGRVRQFGRYDLVIIDPPSRQRGSFDVEKNYGAVLKQLPGLCNPGADVIATLNTPFLEMNYLVDAFTARVPQGEFVEQMPAAPEFADKYPEKGLKICRFRMPG